MTATQITSFERNLPFVGVPAQLSVKEHFSNSLSWFIKCLLVSDVDPSVYEPQISEFVSRVPSSALTYDDSKDATDSPGDHSRYYSAADLYDSTDLINVIVTDMLLHRLEGSSSGYNQYALTFATPQVRSDAQDSLILDHLVKVPYYNRAATHVRDDILILDNMWTSLISSEGFLVGRGDVVLNSTTWSALLTSISTDDLESTDLSEMVNPYFVSSTNAFLASALGVASRVFRYANYANEIISTVYKGIFGKPQAMPPAVSGIVNKISEKLQTYPIKTGFASNIARSRLPQVLSTITKTEDSTEFKRVLPFLKFVKNKLADPTYNPSIGTSNVSDLVLSSSDRLARDSELMNLLKVGSSMLYRAIPHNILTIPAVRALNGYMDNNVNKQSVAGYGRHTSVTNQQPETWETYFEGSSSELQSPLKSSTDLDLKAVASVMENDPYALSAVRENEDIIDQDDLSALVTQIHNLRDENTRLRGTSGASFPTQTRPQVQSATMAQQSQSTYTYANWNLTSTLAALSTGSWSSSAEALELVDRLLDAGFKYNSDRDAAKTYISNAFPLKLSISQISRFPQPGIFVCRDTPEVSSALNDVISALNYKDPENVSGTSVGTVRSKKDAAGSDVVRSTSEYNDASLNYMNSLRKLRLAISNNMFDRTSFERRMGLYWTTT